MEIRVATLRDAGGICQLYNEFWLYNEGLQPEYHQRAIENGEYPKNMIASEDSDIFIAIENDEIIGFMRVREAETLPYPPVVYHRYAEIVELFVTASCRRKGVGSLLMNAAKQWSKARNLDYIELMVLSDAKGEIAFYKQYGLTAASHIMRCTV